MSPTPADRNEPGILCLQGGRELTSPCDEMDRTVLARSSGTVVVLAGAARIGSDYAGASSRAVDHYTRIGAEVTIAADPRVDPVAAHAALADDVGLVVLPGGSPGGLLDVLTTVDDGSIGRRLVELWRAGTGISGASAGAMVMCARTATPDREGGLADGLGLVAGAAIPHWSPGSERRWDLSASPIWGLPECGGVLIDGAGVTAVGQGDPAVGVDGDWRRVSRTGTDPLPI